MPPNTVKVDRTTRWGNPLSPTKSRSLEQCARMCARILTVGVARGEETTLLAYRAFVTAHIGELRGKNLACWCALDSPCHADALLELANSEQPNNHG